MSATNATAPTFSLRVVRDFNTDDLLRAAGLTNLVGDFPSLRRLFDGPSTLLARKLAAFDGTLDQGRPQDAARKLLADLGTRLVGRGESPAKFGPRLFLSNHPGLGDILGLLAVLGAPDLRIVARDRPFLRALPHLLPMLFLVPDRGAWTVLRRVEAHLASGGAVLTFPAGRIEADPAWADPSASWHQWSASTAFWARRVPGLSIQPFLVAGVRARAFVDPWLARGRRKPEDRDWTAAVLQLVTQILWARPRGSKIELAGGSPFSGAAFAPGGQGPAIVHRSLSELASTLRRK